MNVKQIAMAVAIAVMFSLIVGFGIDAFYQAPEYQDYCNDSLYGKPYPVFANEVNCSAYDKDNEMKTNLCYNKQGYPMYNLTEEGCQVFNECSMCQKEFEEVNGKYTRNVFFITLPIGLIAIIVGIYWAIEFMGSGLMFGGILTVMYGTMRYFPTMSRYWRFIVLVLEFIVLIFIGYKKLVEKKAEKKNAKKNRK